MIADFSGDGMSMLVGEAHHRFYNSLQMIVSATNGILRGGVPDAVVRERLEALQDRIAQLADVNRRLSGPFGPESVSKAALERLCAGIAASFDRADAGVAVTVEGRIDAPDTCRTFLLLIGELMTNALKCSAIERPLRMRIHLAAMAERHRLDVTSNTRSARSNADRPRIASELVASRGGMLRVVAEGDEYQVSISLPAR